VINLLYIINISLFKTNMMRLRTKITLWRHDWVPGTRLCHKMSLEQNSRACPIICVPQWCGLETKTAVSRRSHHWCKRKSKTDLKIHGHAYNYDRWIFNISLILHTVERDRQLKTRNPLAWNQSPTVWNACGHNIAVMADITLRKGP